MNTPNPEAPLVSVLMLAYNQASYVSRAIASVVSQKAPFAYELIIADDASTDGTREICRQWQRRYPTVIRLLDEASNMGIMANHVRALQAARGRYIAICEGDDWWMSNRKLARQASWLEAHPEYSMCCHNVVCYYQEDGTKSLGGVLRSGTITLDELTRWNPIQNVSVMYRREAVPRELPAWMSQMGTYDLAMHTLCALTGPIYYMARPMAVYRKLAGSIFTGQAPLQQIAWARHQRDIVRQCLLPEHPAQYKVVGETCARSCLSQIARLEAAEPDKAVVVAQTAALLDEARRYAPHWDAAKLQELLAAVRPALAREGRSRGLRRLATPLRRAFSRFVPVRWL